MNKQILIAYATGSGSTRDVAEAIAAEIEGDGLKTVVLPVEEVTTVTQYGGIVLGSSIRIGRWLPEAVDCLERIQPDLAGKPVAYFTTCLTMIEDTEQNRQTVLNYMEPVLRISPEIKPIGLGLFAGSLDPARRVIMGGGGPQGDYRNWVAIRAWAQKIKEIILDFPGDEAPELAEVVLSFTDMSYSNLNQANLQGAELQSTILVHADMEDSHLEWADLSHSQMQGANLVRANLIGSILANSDLQDANLTEATLNGAILQNANLEGANLSRADLNWVDFSKANLTNADLSLARLGWARLANANLNGANLKGARYNEHTIWPEGFSPEAAGCVNVGRGAV